MPAGAAGRRVAAAGGSYVGPHERQFGDPSAASPNRCSLPLGGRARAPLFDAAVAIGRLLGRGGPAAASPTRAAIGVWCGGTTKDRHLLHRRRAAAGPRGDEAAAELATAAAAVLGVAVAAVAGRWRQEPPPPPPVGRDGAGRVAHQRREVVGAPPKAAMSTL